MILTFVKFKKMNFNLFGHNFIKVVFYYKIMIRIKNHFEENMFVQKITFYVWIKNLYVFCPKKKKKVL